MSYRKLMGILAIVAVTAFGCSNRLEPTEGSFEIPGGKIWYRIVGKGLGTPLIVIHGGPGIPSYYLKSLGELGDDRPVVFYDQLGAGHSSMTSDTTLFTINRFRDELGLLIKHLGVKKVDLYGHSWGAILAAEYTLSNPAMVKSLILASPALDISRWMSDADSLLRTLPDSTQEIIRKNEAAGTYDSPEYQNAVTQFYQMYLSRKLPWSADIDSSMMQMNPALYGYMEGPSEFSITGTLKGYTIAPRLKEIKCPTLFIAGEHDEVLPQTLMYYKSMVPKSQFAFIRDAGHLAMIDNTPAYIESVREFLDRADGKF